MPTLLNRSSISPSATRREGGDVNTSSSQPATSGWWRRYDLEGGPGSDARRDQPISAHLPRLTVTPTVTPPGEPPPLWCRPPSASPSVGSPEEEVVEPDPEAEAVEEDDEGEQEEGLGDGGLSPRPASEVADEPDTFSQPPAGVGWATTDVAEEDPVPHVAYSPFPPQPYSVQPLSADPQQSNPPVRSSGAPSSALFGADDGSSRAIASTLIHQPSEESAPDPEDPDDISEFLEALVTPYEYHPVQLSFGFCGPLSADAQVFRVRNVFGQKIEVRDSNGQLFLKADGQFKPVGYDFTFYDPMGCYVFSICTVDFQEEETYEFIGPHGMVMASAVRTRFNPRTEIRVCANTAKSDNPVEVMCRSMPRRSLLGGRYQVITPEGYALGSIRRHHRKGVVTHQTFTVVVGPEVDPYLMVFLAMACNCINNERPKIAWAMVAAGLALMAL